MEVGLTSARDDGTWTWRAAGAREPKGVLDGGLLPAGAKVGDVLRVDAEVEVDGITVTSILPPKAAKAEPDRLEVLGRPEDTPLVTTSLTGREAREQRRRPDRDRKRPEGERPRREPRGPDAPAAGARPDRARPKPASVERAPRPRPKRLQARRAHRDALLATLAPEQVPVAEQVLKGGIPAVRQAVHDQNEKAKAAGKPEIHAELLVTMAEELLPRLRAAEWRDKAEAAVGQVDEIGLRDIRALVVGSDAAARDDDTRALAARLREALDRRSTQERQVWVDEIVQALDEGRVVRALRISSRPPEAGTRFPPELAARLSEAAGAALAPDAAPDRWATVLDAVLASPVRATVKPAGLPPDAPEELLTSARQAAARIPALATELGIEPPSAPPPRTRRPPPRRPPVPPPPPPAPAPAEAPPEQESA